MLPPSSPPIPRSAASQAVPAALPAGVAAHPPSTTQATAEHPLSTLDLEPVLARAAALLNADEPKQALSLLLPHVQTQEAKAHYGFQSRLGTAHMGVVDALVASNRLGAFALVADDHGDWRNFSVHAEQISSYIGVVGAYGRFLELLRQPDSRARFVQNNGEECFHHVVSGARAGVSHALLESSLFFTRIAQINSNQASRGFVQQALQAGHLNESDSVVQAFRQVEADPLYAAILSATAPVQHAMQEAGETPQPFWHAWQLAKKQALFELPEVKMAISAADEPA